MEEYLTVDEISKILRLSKTKTYALINQRDFPKIKLGGKYIVPKSQFEQFMDKLIYKEYAL